MTSGLLEQRLYAIVQALDGSNVGADALIVVELRRRHRLAGPEEGVVAVVAERLADWWRRKVTPSWAKRARRGV